jgi:hypothetical protein
MRRTYRYMTASVGAAATFVVLTAAPASAFPPVGGKALGFGTTDFGTTAGTRLTTCQNVFSGHVTVQRPDRQGGEISIDGISFRPCDPAAGIAVTPNHLPWTLTLDSRANLTVMGVDLSLVQGNRRCRYTGTLDGAQSFPGIYTIFGALTRQGAGCPGLRRLGVSVLAESISVDGVPLTP